MKRQLFKLSMVALVGVILLGAFGVLPLLGGIAILTGAAGASLATVGAVVPGTVDTTAVKTGSPELDENFVSDKIVEMFPARTPLDTIMRKMGREKSTSQVYEFYKVDTKGVYDTVRTAYTNSGDGAESGNIVVDNISLWSKDDTILIPEILGRDSHPLVLYVNTINRSTLTLTVQALNGADGSGTTATKRIIPTIGVGKKLYRMAKAGGELDAQTTPYAMLPVKESNYAQVFMAQVEESTFQRMTAKEVNWGFSNYEKMNIYDMKMTTEASFIWGYKHYFQDVVETDLKYTTGGVWRNITKKLEYGTGGTNRTVSKSQYINWTKSIFTGNNGSEKRIFLYGSTLGASLHEVDSWQRFVDGAKTEVAFGITFTQIQTNFGTLLAMYHPLFDMYGYGEHGLVLDVNHLVKFSFKDLGEKELDLKGSGQRNVDAKFISEVSGVATRYPDCHAIISPALEGGAS
jgi:hypothetical protein